MTDPATSEPPGPAPSAEAGAASPSSETLDPPGSGGHPGRAWLVSGAVLGWVAVATGAFGAHGLRKHLAATLKDAALEARRLSTWEDACRYAAYHALALLAVGLLAPFARSRALTVAGASFVAGTAVFSGTLWLLVLTGVTKLGMITPIGGTVLLVGWVALAIASSKARPPA